jgi:hypothetical protein
VAEGKPYGVIAERLHVSYKTVANTCTQLKAKLGVRSLPELMRIAIEHLPSAPPARGSKEWSSLALLPIIEAAAMGALHNKMRLLARLTHSRATPC